MAPRVSLGKAFTTATAALVGLAAYLFYEQQQHRSSGSSSQTQLTLHPHPASSLSSAKAEAGGALAFPVVLPPRISVKDRAATEASFLHRCREAAAHGLPSTAEVRCYGGYLASLNYERRIANWVMEVMDARSSIGHDAEEQESQSETSRGSRNQSVFYADQTVPASFQVRQDGYTTRGLSRGHLAPAQLHKDSQAEMDATFNMNANIVPQDMTMNAMDWLRLEKLSKKLQSELVGGKALQRRRGRGGDDHFSDDSKLFIISGPAFVPQWVRLERRPDGSVAQVVMNAPPPNGNGNGAVRQVVQYQLTGRDQLVAVPTHLFKVFLAETHGSKANGATSSKPTYAAAAFLMPNGPITEELPLTAYQVPLERLQQLTGLQLFPALQTSCIPDLCKAFNCDARPAALFQKYRQVAQLRAASSVPALRATYASLQSGLPAGKELDEAVKTEFRRRTEELVLEAIQPVDGAER